MLEFPEHLGFDWVEALKYVLIPFVSGFVGWITNLLAIKMTFYPVNYWGIKRYKLGWQGIIPSKAGRMAEKSVELMTTKLVRVEAQFARIDPGRVSAEMTPALNRLTHEIIEEAFNAEAPLVWRNTPSPIRQRVHQRSVEEIPGIVQQLMDEVKNEITELFDLKKMVVEILESNRPLLNLIFQRVGVEEFKFIERSGFYFGFLFGIIQATVFFFYPAWWILPLAGLFVGWATNWLALKMIFEPQEPRRYGPFVVQGLFIKRQKEVASEYARIVAERILTSRNIFENMLEGPASDRLLGLIQRQIEQAIDEVAGLSRTMLLALQGGDLYERLRRRIAVRFIEELPGSIRHVFNYAEQALAIEATLRDKMSALSAPEFAGFLRPVFQEDEAKLIAVGAALGLIAGVLQLVTLFL